MTAAVDERRSRWLLIVADVNGKGKEREQRPAVVLCRSPEITETEEKGAAGESLSRQQAVDEQWVTGGRWVSPEE